MGTTLSSISAILMKKVVMFWRDIYAYLDSFSEFLSSICYIDMKELSFIIYFGLWMDSRQKVKAYNAHISSISRPPIHVTLKQSE